MRQPQNAKRGRGRGRRNNGNAQPNVPNRNTSYESSGPDVKLRGNAQQLNEKYLALANDAAAAGERWPGCAAGAPMANDSALARTERNACE